MVEWDYQQENEQWDCSRKKPFGKRLTEVFKYGRMELSTRK